MGQDLPSPPLNLYIHIPFCLTRCGYCSFFTLPFSKSALETYLGYLHRELAFYRKLLTQPLNSVYLGGGSPALLSAEQLTMLLQDLPLCPHTEVTLEINPIQLTPSFLSALSTTPVNRLSIGVQSMNDSELEWLNRRHKAEQVQEKITLCRDKGYGNISIDLIYGLPGSSLASLTHSLDAITALQPEHISCYLLSLDEDCPRFADASKLPDEDSQFTQYELIRHYLAAEGYNHYEISNFAKETHASIHNLCYWHSDNYLAIGASAAGWIAPIRYVNHADLQLYYHSVDNQESFPDPSDCSPQRELEDYLMMGLRLLQGIHIPSCNSRFGIDLLHSHATPIQRLKRLGMLCHEADYLRLSEAALFVSNSVIAELIL